MPRVATLFAVLIALAAGCAKTSANTKTSSPNVILETSMGNLVIELFQDKAPVSTKNFLRYVNEGFYDGTIFHRVIPGFVIQGGGFTKDLGRKPVHESIKNEANNGLKNLRGTLSMARTNVVDSATSQFFVNLKDNKALDHRSSSPGGYGYAVFGKVIEGMDVVDKIAKVERLCPSTGGGPCTAKLPPSMRDVPKEPVIILKAKLHTP